ncbi:MAG: hypothetical protein WD627_05425 [Actinomycetota bacterium]
MQATTYYGEFNQCDPAEGSELAKAFARMLCRLNHPSMAGRTLEASAYLKDFIGAEAPLVPK